MSKKIRVLVIGCGNTGASHATAYHNHVGFEPSGRSFNEFVLNKDKKPHNPLINSGAIMVASFLYPECEPSEQFESVKYFYESLSGHIGKIGFDNSVFLSEKRHADRNISLAYYMRENCAFYNNPTPNRLSEILDLYFQCCSITLNCEIASVIAATLANKGACPVSGENVIEPDIVKDCLSLMYMCGMYDYSGQFSFEVGLPAKSGVSGCIFLVIPNKMGICIWSPKLDELGNTNLILEVEKHQNIGFRKFYILDNVQLIRLNSERPKFDLGRR
mgnify:CR=1 FL=1